MEKKNKAILIYRDISKHEKDYILELTKDPENDYDIYLTDAFIIDELKEKGLRFIKLSEDKRSKINSNIFNAIIDFGEININGKPLADIFKIENMSFWHYYKFRIYFFIRNAYFEIELLKQHLENYKHIEVFSENAGWNYYKSDSKSIKLHFTKRKTEKYNYYTILRYLIFFLLRSFSGIFQLKKLKKSKYIIIDHAIKQTILDLNSLEPKKGNYNLEYLFDKLDDDFIILDEKDFPKLKGKSKFFNIDFTLFPKRKILYAEIILLSGLLSGKIRTQTKELDKKLKKKFNEVSNIKFNIENEFIFSYFKSIKPNKLLIFKYLAYNKFFTKFSNIKSISSIDENSPRIKTIFDAAKKNGITTYGIQHGTIHSLHPSYIFSANDTLRKPFPEYNIIWGRYWKKILIEKCHFPEDSLIIAGQIRTDIITKLLKTKLDSTDINPEGKKIIMYASQFQRDENLREKAALDLFHSVKDLDDYQLIIKLHPSEKNEFDYYHRLAKLSGCSNYKILYYYDLYKLIALSEIIVTCFSTVGTEAIYFHKPLIIIDHLNQDLQGYKKAGVAFQATTREEIKKIINHLNQKEIGIDKLKYKNFIDKYAYKIDGKVANRIIQIIKSYSNK